MRRTLIPLALLAAATLCSPAQPAQNEPTDIAALPPLLDRFAAAFRERDVKGFPDLFYSANPQEVIWQFVVEDNRLARVQKFKPEARKARHVPDNNYLSAIQAIAADPLPTEEKFSNVRIDTDGEVASVNFDYVVTVGGKDQNWGREMWHLVRTERGWKIISVIYSARDPVAKAQAGSGSGNELK